MVGKYVQLRDSYKSLNEALIHGGIKSRTRVNIHYVDRPTSRATASHALKGMDAILVPGGFGERGIEGKIQAVRYARENGIPYLGICLGMQLAVIEFARNVLGLDGAQQHRVQPRLAAPGDRADHRMAGQRPGRAAARRDLGDWAAPCASARRPATSAPARCARELYGRDEIIERHRHRYEFNNNYLERYQRAGLRFSGLLEGRPGRDRRAARVIRGSSATQFHPEFTSTPRDGHPLFTGFVRAARAHRAAQLPSRHA